MLVAVSAIGPLAMNLFVPSMPGMQRVFNTDYGTVQLTLTLYLVAVAVAQLLLGPLSDRLGRRPVLMTGLALFLAGTALCAVAPSIEALIAGRVVQAAGGCAGLVLGRAIVRDLYGLERSASVIGYVTMAMVVAPMLGPALGGYLDVWFGWRAGFVLLGIAGVLVLAFAHRELHETHHARISGGVVSLVRGAAQLLRIPLFWAYVFTMAFTTGTFFAFVSGAPYLIVELMDRPASDYGVYFIMVAGGYMLGNFVSGRYATRLGPSRLMFAGTVVTATTLAALLLLTAADVFVPLALFGPMGVIAFAHGLILPGAMASVVSIRPNLAGAASGVSGSLQVAFGALVTVLVARLQGDSQWPMVLIMAACGALGFVSCWIGRVLERRRRPVDQVA